ncbi:MAG TPA: hypothetical protein DEP48_06455 [Persephonella sp.]|uniref:Uncharacterized protein n=1 Tax=Persephonella marina (strain DSM 14350 / EX-H1) TaxID=123214 RepID=C0QUN5_PERMH|nr:MULTISPECIES: hypothetical protein [Persephonella]ACO03669.1 hypothetical protein PERMA_0611 [Persephonella marina EX-H1]HCB69984.1 hypothetical protein [Persephonella sp.]
MVRLVIFLLFFLYSFNSKGENINQIYLNEGLTENQVYNIRLFTTRALNLVLDAYSSLNKKRIIRKETYTYLDASLFFLNEAHQYSPSYIIYRQIEALEKRIQLYPDEDYSEDLKTLLIYIEEISGNLEDYDYVRKKLEDTIKKAAFLENQYVLDSLEIIKEKVSIPLIDDPLTEAKNLIGIAKDHLKAREYKKSKQALELALNPLINISYRENLYMALVKEYIHKGKVTYNLNRRISLRYLEASLYAVNKAFYVSSRENRDLIKMLREDIRLIFKNFYDEKNTEKMLNDIIEKLKNIR